MVRLERSHPARLRRRHGQSARGSVARHRPGTVHVTADFGVELVATVTADAARELGLAPGVPVTFAFKASAVQVF